MSKRILVIEDNLDSRDLIHLLLTMTGFTVLVATDGREGLNMASAEHPDLIITDISMPRLDGIELIKQLRAQPDFENLPILVLTSFGRKQREEAVQAGASRVIRKPTLFDSLVADVHELLSERVN